MPHLTEDQFRNHAHAAGETHRPENHSEASSGLADWITDWDAQFRRLAGLTGDRADALIRWIRAFPLS